MYVYETKNLINGKKYIGVSVTNSNSENYLGSGTLLKRAIKKYGVQNFSKTILKYFDTEKSAREYERKLISELNAIEDDGYYNLVAGGYGGGVRKHPVTIETRKKISNSHKGKKLTRKQVVGMGKITLQYDLDGHFLQSFETKADAERLVGSKLTKLKENGVYFIKGYLWSYKNGEIKNKIASYAELKENYKILASKKSAKLSKEDVINLVKDKDIGLTYSELSAKYGITESCAYEIVSGKTYKWVWE
jgi:hypothetical protein